MKNLFRARTMTALFVPVLALAGTACIPAESTGSGDGGTGTGTGTSTGTGGSTGGSSTGAGGGGTTSSSSVEEKGLTLLGEAAKVIDPGSSYQPENIDGIPPFSSAAIRIGVRNDSDAPITIAEVTVEAKDGTLPDEWVISKPGSTKREPFELKDVTLAAGESTEFGLHFWAFASGPRPATVTVKTSAGTSTGFVVDGRGRDNLALSTQVSATTEMVLTAPSADFNVGGIVSDGNGGAVYSANAVQLLDVNGRDVMLSGVKADGTQAWAKVWNEPYMQESPAPDQNNETGGGADSIDLGGDGHVYLAASRSVSSSNSIPASFQALVVKVDAGTGAMKWARGFRNSTFASPDQGESQAWRGAVGYGVDASLADRVLSVGFTGSPPRMLLTALGKSDGAMLYAHQIDIGDDGLADRAFTIRTDASGAGWIGGDQNGRAVLVRMTGLNGTPAIAGTFDLGVGVGSRINSIALAPGGDAVVSLYTGGADRSFVVARVKSDGSVVWSKTWESGSFGGNDNAHVVRLDGGIVWAGGNVAVQAADTTHGDGFVLALDADTGDYKVGALYYSGKNTEYVEKHLVKGFVFGGGEVFSLTQGNTVQGNFDHYWGYWYQAPDDKLELPAGDGSMRLADYPLTSQSLDGVALLSLAPGVSGPNGTNGGTAHSIDTSTLWKDLPPAAVWEKAKEHSGEVNQTHPLFSKLTLKP